jgi:hypothetical protein
VLAVTSLMKSSSSLSVLNMAGCEIQTVSVVFHVWMDFLITAFWYTFGAHERSCTSDSINIHITLVLQFSCSKSPYCLCTAWCTSHVQGLDGIYCAAPEYRHVLMWVESRTSSRSLSATDVHSWAFYAEPQ